MLDRKRRYQHEPREDLQVLKSYHKIHDTNMEIQVQMISVVLHHDRLLGRVLWRNSNR